MEISYLTLNDAWEQIQKEATVWDNLEIRTQSFYYKHEEEFIYLSTFNPKKLPATSYKLRPLGKFLTKTSHFANIMSCRPGTEEVTFYALINSPQKKFGGQYLDEKMLSVAAPPLTWRRNQIREFIKQKIELCTKYQQSFLFLDIGSGGGFDSLEIERYVHRLTELTDKNTNMPSYLNINVDIDSKWLGNNRLLSQKLFGDNHNILNKSISAFDFLSDEEFCNNYFNKYDHLIVSCNGFAEFLNDSDLRKLYCGIHELAETFDGNVHITLPFANNNEAHEALGKKIGFEFRAKSKNQIVKLIEDIFYNYLVSYNEKHSQIILILEKPV